MEASEFIAENEVTTENLAAIFKRAFFSTSLDEDGDLFVQTDDIRRVYVIVDERHKLLSYRALFSVKETASLESKHAFVNKLNDDYILVRFSIMESHSDCLAADYSLPFEEGIPAFQIGSALRRFSRVAFKAIYDSDDNDVVE